METKHDTLSSRCISKAILYTDLPIEQLEIAFNSEDKVVRDMIFNIISFTNLEDTYYDLFTNIKYYDHVHPDFTYKIIVNE
jgi:hypothetical protein